MDKKTQFNIWYAVLALFGVLFLQNLWMESQTVERLPYSVFEQKLKDGEIERIFVKQNTIEGEFRSAAGEAPKRFVTVRVEPELAADLDKYNVEFSGVVESTFLRDLLSWILPVLMFFAIWVFIFRRFADRQGLGGFMSVGKSKAKVYVESDTQVTFEDVAGVDEAKEELQEIVSFLKDPQSYGRLGAHIPKGVLLVGPPGTGKTLLAKAVAGEASVPFFSINGSEFVEMFVGVGAARVRDLFEQANAQAPAIIFIDELDALGRARAGATGIGGGHDEREQTLNQLLAELDGFDPSKGVVLLAATNRPEILDPALLRAGRFDRQILVDRPDKAGREAILKVHMKKVELSPDIDAEAIAALTTGFSGADLANLVNEAALLATRRQGDFVTLDDFTRAIERIVAGLEKKNRLLNPMERKVVAYHELGHALVSLALPGMERVHKVSIIPRGIGSLGYTIQRPTEDRYLMTRTELFNKICVLLGGRAAEKLIFEHLSTGAADDLAKVTDIARSMVTRYGMDEALGYVVYDAPKSQFLGQGDGAPTYLERRFSEDTAHDIDEAVRRIVDDAFQRTIGILQQNRALLERCAAVLLQKETLLEDEIASLTVGLVPANDAPETAMPQKTGSGQS